MNSELFEIHTWLPEDMAARLVEVLVHSLWQGGVIAVGLWLCLRGLPARYTRLRYSLAVTALPMLLLAVALTWSVLAVAQADRGSLSVSGEVSAGAPPTEVVAQVKAVVEDSRAQPSLAGAKASADTSQTIAASSTPTAGTQTVASSSMNTAGPASTVASHESGVIAGAYRAFGDFFRGQDNAWRASAMLLAWLGIAGLLVLRTVLGFGLGRRRLAAGAGVVEDAVEQAATRVAKKLGLRRSVTVLRQARCAVPCVVGVLRPVVLLPPAVLLGLTPTQLEAVLAHELAHIRRWDAVVDFIQRLFTSVLFFNPGVYWLNRQIRQEREACCDAAAAQVVGDPAIVVEALHTVARLASKTSPQQPGWQVAGAPASPERSAPAPALAATDGQLKNRVTRLLIPGGRPSAVLRWPTVLAILGLSAAGLWFVERGADATIALAEEILNPEAYIEETQRFVEEGGALTEDWAKKGNREERDDQKNHATVSGTIRSADGSPLDDQLSLMIHSQHPSGSGYGLGLPTEAGPTPDVRTFHCERVPAGMVSVRVNTDQLAPLMTDRQLVRPGTAVNDLDLVLEPGFSMKVQIVDPQGKPLPDATIHSARVLFATGESGYVTPKGDAAQADAQGWVTLRRLTHTGTTSLKAIVDAPGFMRATAETQMKADGTWRIAMSPAKPVTGLVLDADTSEPLPGAEIHAIYRTDVHGNDPRAPYYKKEPLAVADTEGRFTLDGFSDREEASLWIQSPGRTSQVLWNVNGGDDLRIVMPQALTLRVELTGAIESLEKNREGQGYVSLSQSLRMKEDSSHGRSFRAIVRTDEQGNHFAIFDRHLLPGKAEVYAGQVVSAIEDLASLEMIHIELEAAEVVAEADERGLREVVIELIPPKGWPAPEGEIELAGRFEPNQRDRHYRIQRRVLVKEGQARFSVFLNREDRRDRPSAFGVEGLDAPGYWLPTYRPFGPDRWTGELVLDENAQEPQVFRLEVFPAGVIRGRVVDEDGNPLSAADLSLQKIEEPKAIFGENQTRSDIWNNIDADHEGRFVITPVPFGGTYRPNASAWRTMGRYAAGWAEPITLSAKQPHAEITIVVPRGQDAAITVLDPDGKPVVNAEVEISRRVPGGGGMGWSPNEFTDAQGRFVFEHLNFDLPGTTDKVTYTISVLPTGPYKGVSYEVDPKNPDRVIRLERGMALSGVLLDDETGEPLPNVEVTAQQKDWHGPDAVGYRGVVTGKTDERGRFVLEGLEDTAYRIQAEGYLAEGSVINRAPATGRALSYRLGDWPVAEPTDEPVGEDEEPELKVRVIKSPWG